METDPTILVVGYEEKMDSHEDADSHHDEGAANLAIMVGLLENNKIKQLKVRVIQLQNDFISDIDSRIEQINTKYLDGLCKSIRTLSRNQNL